MSGIYNSSAPSPASSGLGARSGLSVTRSAVSPSPGVWSSRKWGSSSPTRRAPGGPDGSVESFDVTGRDRHRAVRWVWSSSPPVTLCVAQIEGAQHARHDPRARRPPERAGQQVAGATAGAAPDAVVGEPLDLAPGSADELRPRSPCSGRVWRQRWHVDVPAAGRSRPDGLTLDRGDPRDVLLARPLWMREPRFTHACRQGTAELSGESSPRFLRAAAAGEGVPLHNVRSRPATAPGPRAYRPRWPGASRPRVVALTLTKSYFNLREAHMCGAISASAAMALAVASSPAIADSQRAAADWPCDSWAFCIYSGTHGNGHHLSGSGV